MLVRPDATYFDQAVKRPERVFPTGPTWLTFESRLPAPEVFANSVLEPAIGISGDLALRTFANAEWQNWISSTQIAVFEIATRIGVPPFADRGVTQGLSLVYNNITASLDAFGDLDNPAAVVPELLKSTGLQVLQQLAGQLPMAGGGMVGQAFAQVLAVAIWAIDVGLAFKEDQLQKNVSLPPLQTEDPATDTWQVNRIYQVMRQQGSGGVVFPDGKIEPASNADYTSFYLPAYRATQAWQIQWREGGLAAQQGSPRESRGPSGETVPYQFDIGDGSTFGFMPGTGVTLRVLQASCRYYNTVRGTEVNRYTLRCRGVDEPCYKSVKSFDGSKDCRQCVDAESVWPVKGIGWAYGGAPINATTPGENVGAFYPTTNKLLNSLLDMIARPGPLLFTINVKEIREHWQLTFESFWEFMAREWTRYKGYGWRGLFCRLASLMTAFEDEGEIVLGGRLRNMPLDLYVSPRDASRFELSFEHSIYKRVIEPYCDYLLNLQRSALRSFEVAYVTPGAGALYHDGKLRTGELAQRFIAEREALLTSAKRMQIDLRRVSDKDFRNRLAAAGVKTSPVNPALQGSPGVIDAPDLKPARAIKPARKVGRPVLAGANDLAKAAPKPARAGRSDSPSKTALAAGVITGSALTFGAALIVAHTVTKPAERDE